MNIREALAKANKQLLAKIDDAMTKEVFEAVRDEEVATISEEVYKVYTPLMYRRREKDGLSDEENIEIQGGSVKGGRLVVINVTQPNPRAVNEDQVTMGKSLPELVEYGDGYKFYYYDFPSARGRYMKARPFTARTIEHLKENHAHISALKKGLRRQGVNVK